MINSNTTYRKSAETINQYKMHEISMATPEQCVLHVYDIAIQGCMKKEPQKTGKALAALIDALDFEAGGDFARGLYSLYEYCIRNVYDKQFDNTLKILTDLRETWQAALNRQAAA